MSNQFPTLNRRWLYLPVEVKAREYLSRILLGCFAVERGFGVVLGDKNILNPNLINFAPGVVLEKSLAINRYGFLKSIKDHGHIILNLDEEGLASTGNRDVYLNQRVSERTAALADILFFWGRKERDIACEKIKDLGKICIVSGNPRIDLLRKSLRNFYNDQASIYRKKYGKYILIPSSYGAQRLKGEKFFIEYAYQYELIKNKEDEKKCVDYYRHKEKNHNAFLTAIPEIAKVFPDYTIIFRPHPSEKSKYWRNQFKPIDSIQICEKGSITPWILGSEVLIHNGCTTGLEAYLLDVPVITYMPYRNKTSQDIISNMLSFKVESVDELMICIRNCLLDNKVKILKDYEKEELNSQIASLKGKLASEKIIENIDNLSIEKRFQEFDRYAHAKDKNLAMKALAITRAQLSYLRKTWGLNRSMKFSHSSLAEVNGIIKKLSTTTSYFKDIQAEKIDHNLYCMFK
ncbi:surface carbohydrate biosynthesis protein [Thermodesulfobacteriota bacterium]